MAQSLELNIKTTSDVPQAMDKAKTATVSFGKQVEDIQRKFSTAFKDIALGFVAPMVLLNSAINYIGAAIEKRKADIKEAYDFALKAESKYLDAETVFLAKQRASKEGEAKDKELAAQAKLTEYTKFLEQSGMRDKVAEEIGGFRGFRIKYGLDANSAEALAKDADVQAVINRMIAPSVAASKKAAELAEQEANKKKTGDADKAKPKELDAKPTSFKAPEGFSNVVGVGANPVIEAMTAQLEEQRKQTALLERIAGSGNQIPTDFTKPTAAPSRASMLR
jgi:hypothetical protein